MDRLLRDLGATERFRDPIYGFIRLTPDELRIIDTPIFQRLRRIHQLALTMYVYPTAEHSRFVHSLGTLHTATAIFAGLFKKEISSPSLSALLQDLHALRYAALLHDIGHLPFSHAAEEDWLKTFDHETLGHYIVEHNPEISAVLGSHKPKTLSILKKENRNDWYLHDIISGVLDADRADYLLRDSYMCGVKYGEYDANRYFQSFTLKNTEQGKKIVVNERDVHVIESFIIARHHYNMQVPYHRTRTGYDISLRKYLSTMGNKEKILRFFSTDTLGNINKFKFDAFINLDEHSIFEQAKQDCATNPYAGYLLRAKHLTPIFDRSVEAREIPCAAQKILSTMQSCPRHGEDESCPQVPNLQSAIEEECVFSKYSQLDATNTEIFKEIPGILKGKGFQEETDFFKNSTVVKVANFRIESEDPNTHHDHRIWVELRGAAQRLEPLSEVSHILKYLPSKIRMLRIYASPEKAEPIKKVLKEAGIQ